ncbi:MAG TPA: adenosine deaminase [Oceanospirillales bacterium]|nr:adenosine deaminase [Oceanospirillaceae bacterium]MAR01562.1 adenosine deaminase [Oceanospirillaceae bacterium]HBS43088.1 adenosine deaminase [Oceanospirillales bacterium]
MFFRSIKSRALMTLGVIGSLSLSATSQADWFDDFRDSASDEELYALLYAMPKGGDLHHHISGSARSEWWYEEILRQESLGYTYYTKVTINNCRAYGGNEFNFAPYLLLFRTVSERNFQQLPECEKSEYKKIQDLTEDEKSGFLNSIRLDKNHEGRDEFFQTHWQRLNDLTSNPYLMLEVLARNIKAFSKEGLMYMETMMGSEGYEAPDGSVIPDTHFIQMLRDRLAQDDIKKTGMTLRFQESILRFAPNAEQQLIRDYKSVAANSDLYVAVNMVGREDNDKGYPLRFLPTLRELRKTYNDVKLSIHAGEVDEPNFHIRDTLLLGADRIGHGVNLITDNELMREMRHGPYLVEINLISNLLLEYVDDYSQHPFPEYLRIGIPVALSTDDRGMWDSNITDEFFVAVKEFNLSWEEIKTLSRNSLQYSFLDTETKEDLLATFDKRISRFEKKATSGDYTPAKVDDVSYGFTCHQYGLCLK